MPLTLWGSAYPMQMVKVDGGPELVVFQPQTLDEVIGASAAGVVPALSLSSTLEAFMFEVSARDPLVLSIAALVLMSVAVVSSFLPALRATRTDPMESFRAD